MEFTEEINMGEIIDNEIESQKFKEAEQRDRTFNGMTAREWTLNSRSVWNDLSSARKKKHLNHGATYPEKLCDRVISMYSKKGDTILDPFLGTGTTIISAINNDRYGNYLPNTLILPIKKYKAQLTY